MRAQYARLLRAHVSEMTYPLDQAFWTTSLQEGVLACVWHGLQKQGADLTEEQRMLVEQPLREQMAHTLMLRGVAAEVLRLLAANEIQVVMLRGQALAEALYAPASLRPQTDIDLLIREQDVACLEQTLVEAGFRRVPHHALLFVRGKVMLDVHTEPLGIERMDSWAQLTPLRASNFFAAAHAGAIAGQPALLVAHKVNLPYLCFHAMKHSFERLIWLWDISLLARQVSRQQCWDEVLAGIIHLSLQRPCFYALSYANAHLDAELPREVLAALHPAMGRRERGLFERFMAHQQVPFLAERVFARMQPDVVHRVAFWKETIWPSATVREQVDADPQARGGFFGKRMRQISQAAAMILRELLASLRRG